jgi:hypothetical protein
VSDREGASARKVDEDEVDEGAADEDGSEGEDEHTLVYHRNADLLDLDQIEKSSAYQYQLHC